jgi:hypothetical protein
VYFVIKEVVNEKKYGFWFYNIFNTSTNYFYGWQSLLYFSKETFVKYLCHLENLKLL